MPPPLSAAQVLTSCDDNTDNPVPAKKKYRLVQRKDVSDNTDTYYIADYGYDDQGRLVSYVNKAYNTPQGDGIVAKYTYTYSDHYIIEKNYNNFYTYYTLNDEGLIVKQQGFTPKDGAEIPYSPDYFQYNDGRILSYEEGDGAHMRTFHWEDGDLMSYEQEKKEDATSVVTYTRSELSVDHGYLKAPLSTMSEPLYMMGYYGKPSKHLESHYKSESNSSTVYILFDNDYTYTIADGHIVEMVEVVNTTMKFGAYESKSTRTATTTLTYEEVN